MSDETDTGESKSIRLQTPPGIHDTLPKDHEYHTFIKKVVRHRARQAGFRRISTPVVEYAQLFEHSIGKHTDIVDDQLYSFEDAGGKRLALKPEGTSGVVRAYVQHNMNKWAQPVELYYIEPQFRFVQPKKGTYRMFWQFGFEVIGESDPALDVQMIQLAVKIFKDLGIDEYYALQINNLGSVKTQEKYREALMDYYIGKERSLCEQCGERMHANPMRLLNCEEEDCQILAKMAPKLEDYRSKEDQAHHASVLEYLDELGIAYTENDQLVRRCDYYTQTAWEFWDNEREGDEGSVLGGGRYDGLVEALGGEETPAVGFACGMDRLILKMKKNNILVPCKDNVHVLVAQLGDLAKKKCLPLIEELRDRGVKTVGSLGKGSIQSQLDIANHHKAPYAIIMGSTEVREGKAIIRDMSKGQQRHVMLDKVVNEMVKLIGESELDKYSPGEVSISKE